MGWSVCSARRSKIFIDEREEDGLELEDEVAEPRDGHPELLASSRQRLSGWIGS
jgi:hypothetical protein